MTTPVLIGWIALGLSISALFFSRSCTLGHVLGA